MPKAKTAGECGLALETRSAEIPGVEGTSGEKKVVKKTGTKPAGRKVREVRSTIAEAAETKVTAEANTKSKLSEPDDITGPAEPATKAKPAAKAPKKNKKSTKQPLNTIAKKTAATETDADKPPPPTKVVLGHVFKTLHGELSKLGQQEGNKSQDRERASRSLSQHANTLEKVLRMKHDLKTTAKKQKGVSAKDKEMLTHAEDLRRVIADRIHKLKSERDNSK